MLWIKLSNQYSNWCFFLDTFYFSGQIMYKWDMFFIIIALKSYRKVLDNIWKKTKMRRIRDWKEARFILFQEKYESWTYFILKYVFMKCWKNLSRPWPWPCPYVELKSSVSRRRLPQTPTLLEVKPKTYVLKWLFNLHRIKNKTAAELFCPLLLYSQPSI